MQKVNRAPSRNHFTLVTAANAIMRSRLYRARASRVLGRVSGFFPKGPVPGSDSAFALLRLRLLSILAGERDHHAKPSSVLLGVRVLALSAGCCSAVSSMLAQGVKQTLPQNPTPDSDADHIKERNELFFRGRLVHGKSSAELRHRAYQAKLQMRAQHALARRRFYGAQPISLPCAEEHVPGVRSIRCEPWL